MNAEDYFGSGHSVFEAYHTQLDTLNPSSEYLASWIHARTIIFDSEPYDDIQESS